MITSGNPWVSEARRNPYPFVDTASLTDATGLLRLSPAWILDAKIWPVLETPSRLYISAIERLLTSVIITVSSLEGPVGSVVVTDLSKRRVALRNSAGNPVGFLSFSPGGLQQLHDVPSRLYEFAVGSTEFVASAIAIQAASGIQSLGDGHGAALTSNFSIVGGEGVRLIVQSGNRIRVDVLGDPYFFRETCENPTALGLALRPVRAIHFKDLTVVEGDVTPGGEGIVKPYAGNISTVVTSIQGDPKARAFQSPGPDLVFLNRIGG